MRTLSLLLSAAALCLSFQALGAEFDLAGSYAQSRDFWRTVHDVQDRTGDLTEIQNVLKDRYGRPDFGYSYLDAAYAYPQNSFESETFAHAVIGTRAEAIAGGQVSNPISPEIQAYADSVGIASFGLRSRADALARGRSFWEWRLHAGAGPEKRVYAQGAEFIDAIPVRSGTLLLGGMSLGFLDQSEYGGDFWVTTSASVRATYFHSSVAAPRSRPDESYSFATYRWRLQNEWLKEASTFLSSRTRFGVITVLGQNPVPFLHLPVTWDYQQRLRVFPGIGSVSGVGGILRLLSASAVPNLALYAGLFGGGIGGGADLQLGPVLLNASTYSIENLLTVSRDNTRIWQAGIGVSL